MKKIESYWGEIVQEMNFFPQPEIILFQYTSLENSGNNKGDLLN